MKTVLGFKNFLMQGNVIVAAIGLAIALAFSTLVKAFTDNIVTPLVNAAGSPGATGLGVHVHGQLIDFGAVIGGGARGVYPLGPPAAQPPCAAAPVSRPGRWAGSGSR